MTTTVWPLEMSQLILDYTGHIQTAAQIARDKEIERRARWKMPAVFIELSRMNRQFQRSDDDYGDDEDPEYEKSKCIEPSFVQECVMTHRYHAKNGPYMGNYIKGYDWRGTLAEQFAAMNA